MKNHGIPEEHINGSVAAGKDFFALPDEAKLKVCKRIQMIPVNICYNNQRKYDVRKSPTFEGFNPLMSENNDPNNNGDMHEAFNLGPEYIGSDSAMSSPNVWPNDELPDFRERILKF